MWFSDWGFAADWKDFGTIWWVLDFVVSILSWIWILLAKAAWELLTNKWVYWEVIGIDSLLWRYRNVVKNIANFGLWFYFVYIVFKALIGKEDITKKIKEMLLWILIAWIWIQASWFLTAVVVDVSTITLVAAWSFPSQVISKSNLLKESVDNSLKEFKDEKWEIIHVKRIDLFPKDASANTFLQEVDGKLSQAKTEEEIYDMLMPNAETISWPLYFMWVSILKAYRIPSVDTSDSKAIKKTIFNLIVQWWTTIVYSIEMFVLFALAFMRLLYLWMFIILSPLVVLVSCLKQMNKKDKTGLSFLDKIMEQVDLKSFLLNVFKPTIIVFWISLSMLLVVMMNWLTNKAQDYKVDIDWVTVEGSKDSTKPNGQPGDETYRTSISTSAGSYEFTSIWKSIWDFIISIFTIILVYFVIKIAVNMRWGKDFVSKDFVSENIETLQKNIGWAITSMPLVPVSWYDNNWFETTRYVSVGSTFWIGGSESVAEQWVKNMKNVYDMKTSNDVDKLMGSWWVVGNWLTNTEQQGIRETIGKWWIEWLRWVKAKISSGEKGMTLGSNPGDGWFWINQFWQWLTNMNEKSVTWTNNDAAWNSMINAWNTSQTTDIEKKIKEIFDRHSDRVKAYADFFNIKLGAYDWDHLKDADISKWTSTTTS